MPLPVTWIILCGSCQSPIWDNSLQQMDQKDFLSVCLSVLVDLIWFSFVLDLEEDFIQTLGSIDFLLLWLIDSLLLLFVVEFEFEGGLFSAMVKLAIWLVDWFFESISSHAARLGLWTIVPVIQLVLSGVSRSIRLGGRRDDQVEYISDAFQLVIHEVNGASLPSSLPLPPSSLPQCRPLIHSSRRAAFLGMSPWFSAFLRPLLCPPLPSLLIFSNENEFECFVSLPFFLSFFFSLWSSLSGTQFLRYRNDPKLDCCWLLFLFVC